ncbi:MAG: hypothetical protein K2H13_09275 [Eubacterium sp.]|nr:hypothetical protein [Eubacterium sp.]
MENIFKQCIERIYIDKDYDFFRAKCAESINYLSDLVKLAESQCEKTIVCDIHNSPSVEIWFFYKPYSQGDFSAEFNTILKISKICGVFAFHHQFSVKNISPQKIEPELGGYDANPYIKSQWDLEDILSDFLTSRGLVKSYINELEEVVGGGPLPNPTIFGKQLTVENALFRDLYDILED